MEKIKLPAWSSSIKADFASVFNDKDFLPDVKVTFGNSPHVIWVHKVILSVRSPYYKNFFSGITKLNQANLTTIEMQSHVYDSALQLFRFIYTATCIADQQNAEVLGKMADRNSLPDLKTIAQNPKPGIVWIPCTSNINFWYLDSNRLWKYSSKGNIIHSRLKYVPCACVLNLFRFSGKC